MELVPGKYLLYAEDDPDDQDVLREMILKIAPHVGLVTCPQGLALMQYLDALQPGEALPCCVILDMNMPIWDGMKTLEELKKHKSFKHLPTVIFTTSDSPRSAERAKELGAEAFVTKPIQQTQMEGVAKRFSLFCDFNVSYK